ncbi:MAG: hypothetical protein JJU02_04905 [Cryomorphaceae bacterium]|nr:hypothetical protein [Cryomorphaceae bacterium]
MIQLIAQENLDEEKWDNCIRRDPSGHFYAYHWYLDMVAKNWDVLVYGDYEWVMPLVYNKKWGLIPYLYRPYGVQQLGIFGEEKVDEKIVRSFISAIPRKYIHRDMYFNVGNAFPKEIKHILRRTYEIDLQDSYETIYGRYHKQTLRNLKRADKAGLTILENDSPDVLVRLFRNNRGAKLSNFTEWHYGRMKQIIYTLIYRKMGSVYSVYDERNAVCASAFVAFTGKRMVFLFSGQDDYGRNHGGLTKLIDNMLMQGASRGGVFDFEGSDIPGLEEFYQRFGATERTYANYRYWGIGLMNV